MISDIDVANGALFGADGSRRFDAAMIGHQEYVTQKEYAQFRLFVASGGRLVAMSSNEFYAKVRFDPATRTETFVTGHCGYAFNGRTAWYGSSIRPPWNTSGGLEAPTAASTSSINMGHPSTRLTPSGGCCTNTMAIDYFSATPPTRRTRCRTSPRLQP